MINCAECFLRGSKLCLENIPNELDCPYFTTEEEAKEKIIHEKELPKIMQDRAVREAKEREERLRKEILTERFRLEQYYNEPWRFSIVNRLTDEQIEDFVKRDKKPNRDYCYYSEDFKVTYGGSREELQKIAIEEIKTWIIDTKEEIENLQDDVVRAESRIQAELLNQKGE